LDRRTRQRRLVEPHHRAGGAARPAAARLMNPAPGLRRRLEEAATVAVRSHRRPKKDMHDGFFVPGPLRVPPQLCNQNSQVQRTRALESACVTESASGGTMDRDTTNRRLMASVFTPIALAVPAFLMSAGVSFADTAAAQTVPGAQLEEVVVTARKREESVQKVPIAITALAGQLKAADIENISDIVAYTPNVRIDAAPARADAPEITIRGVSAAVTTDNSFEAPVGVFIDGVYLGTLPGQLLENFDLQRVEILRGPQGTLFGRNTIGGAVNVVRTEPTGEWGANVSYQTGSWNDQEFKGVFNAPIIKDVLALKLFINSENRDGYLYNTYLHINQPQKNYKNYGFEFKFTPNDRFKALLTGERYEDSSQGGAYLGNYNVCPGLVSPSSNPNQPNISGGLLDEFLPGVFGLPNTPCRSSLAVPTTTSTAIPNPGYVSTYAVTLNMSYALNDHLKLVSVTGYRNQHEKDEFEFDGSSADFITISTNAHYHQFSEELRAEGNWDTGIGKISAVAGAFYYNNYFSRGWTTGGNFWNFVEDLSSADFVNNTWLPGANTGGYATPIAACLAKAGVYALPNNIYCDAGAGNNAYGQGTLQKLFETQGDNSVALFSHADWEFVPKLTLSAGVRWTYERKDFVGYQSYLAPLSRIGNFDFPFSTGDLIRSWSQVTPTVSLAYQAARDLMFYGSFSEGWHSGGFYGVNQDVQDFKQVYEPETSQSYELGMKSQFFDHRVQFNLTGFLNEFHNLQQSAVQTDQSTNTVVTVFTNIGGIRYYGLEAELQWIVTPQLHLQATAGYLNAKYTSLNIVYPANVNGNTVTETNATFLTPDNSPKWTLGGDAAYTIPVGPGDLQLETKVTWVDSIYTTLYDEPFGYIPAHTDLELSASYSYKNYKVTAFGHNVTNWIHETPDLQIVPLFAPSTITPGANWGLRLEAKF